jgi:hypothetical protein
MSKEVRMNPALLLKAIAFAFAADKRFGQRRKDAEESPYINHPIAVATVLAVEGGVSNEPFCWLPFCMILSRIQTPPSQNSKKRSGRKWLDLFAS